MLAKAGQALYQQQERIRNLELKIEADIECSKAWEIAILHNVEQTAERISTLECLSTSAAPTPGVKRSRSRDGEPDMDTVIHLEDSIGENSKKINQVAERVTKLDVKLNDLRMNGGPTGPKTSNAAIISLHNRICALEGRGSGTRDRDYTRHGSAGGRSARQGGGRNWKSYDDSGKAGEEDILGLSDPVVVDQPVRNPTLLCVVRTTNITMSGPTSLPNRQG